MNAKKKVNICKGCGISFYKRKSGRNHKLYYCSMVCSTFGKIKYKTDEERLIASRKNKSDYKKRNKEKVLLAQRKRWKIKARERGILPHISKEEVSIYKDLLKDYKPNEILRNYRGVIKSPITNYPLELDFYIPSEKRAIEVNGACHRQITRGGKERFLERQRNDIIKKQECERMGIKLEIINV